MAFRMRKPFGNFEKRAPLGLAVRKPATCANPGLKINRGIDFSYIKVFFTPYVRLLIPAQNCRANNINSWKTSPKGNKYETKFLLFLEYLSYFLQSLSNIPCNLVKATNKFQKFEN